MDSKRAYLMKRLFQFSNLVWRIDLDDKGPKMVLEKGIEIADCTNEAISGIASSSRTWILQ